MQVKSCQTETILITDREVSETMNILPVQLKGKVIKDAYEIGRWSPELVIEFTDGTQIRVSGLRQFKSNYSGGTETYLELETKVSK